MKRSLVTILVVALFVQSTSILWITGAFYLNREYIAEYLCINREKPITMCNGSCYLEKQIKKEQEKEQKLPDIKVKEVTLFCEVREGKGPPPVQTDFNNAFKAYRPEFYQCEYSPAVFHPPAIS